MKHILFLMGVYPEIGGVGFVTTILANELNSRGYKITLCSFESKEDMILQKLSPLVRCVKLSYPVNSKLNREELHNYIVKENVDLIINQWCMPYYVSSLCKASIHGTQCKLVAVHHNLPCLNNHIVHLQGLIKEKKGFVVWNKLKLELVTLASRLSLRYTYQVSDRYIVLSPSFIPIARKFMFLSKDVHKIDSIPNPVTIEESLPDNQVKQKVIIYVGRIEFKQKRNDRLVGIWREIEKKYPDWKLEIIGDGPDKINLINLIKQNHLKNISMKGFQNPLEYYRKGQILLLTSDYEGFGLVIVEGMKFGVIPLVYGSYDAVYDIIEDGVNGYIIPKPYHQENMVRCIEKLIEDCLLRNQMSHQAILKSKKFNVKDIVNKWEILFHSLTNNMNS